MKIARTLMETVVSAEYLPKSPPELDAYLAWAWVEKNEDLAYLKENVKYFLPQPTKIRIWLDLGPVQSPDGRRLRKRRCLP